VVQAKKKKKKNYGSGYIHLFFRSHHFSIAFAQLTAWNSNINLPEPTEAFVPVTRIHRARAAFPRISQNGMEATAT
jgi:hypothetical protein